MKGQPVVVSHLEFKASRIESAHLLAVKGVTPGWGYISDGTSTTFYPPGWFDPASRGAAAVVDLELQPDGSWAVPTKPTDFVNSIPSEEKPCL